MALLQNLKKNTLVYLLAHHRFGRLEYSVDTLIPNIQISKIHAIIEWNNDCWFIRDISKNGTWLNQIELLENKNYKLSKGDTIRFANDKKEGFQVFDLEPPSDYLIRISKNAEETNKPNTLNEVIALSDYSILPTEEDAEVILYFDKIKHNWCTEYIDDVDHKKFYLGRDGILKFAGKYWQLKFNNLEEPTDVLINKDKPSVAFKFTTSLDEENTQLILNLNSLIIDFEIRAHHYLTLRLAKYRYDDAINGLDNLSQGWIYTEQVAKDIGIDITHLNILVHRAKKQFSIATDNSIELENLIQRRPGELRFGNNNFRVFKGESLQFELPNLAILNE